MAKPPEDTDAPEAGTPKADKLEAGKPKADTPKTGSKKQAAKRAPAKRSGGSAARPAAKAMPKANAEPVANAVGTSEKETFARTLSKEAARGAGLWSDAPVEADAAHQDTAPEQSAAQNSGPSKPGTEENEPSKAAADAPSVEPKTETAQAGFMARFRDRARKSVPANLEDKTSGGAGSRPNSLAQAAQSGVDKFGSAIRAIPLPTVKKPENLSDFAPRWSWVDSWATTLTPTFNALAYVRVIAAACIALIAITAFLPGFTTIPPLDRDESRFSQATRQMVNTGDYVDIRFQSEPRYQKPIGIYWMQSIAVNLYGAEDGQAPIWVYRTVSLVGAVAAAVLVYWLALAFGAPPVAFAAGALVALTILLGAEARLAKTDAMLFAVILVAQGVLARAFLGKRDSSVKPWHAGLFWTAAAAGILIKGPILPLVVGSTAIAASLIDRRIQWLRRLRPGLGVMWMLILVLPWFIAIGITSAGEFYAQSIGRDFLEKIGTSRERPFVPPGVFTFGFFPGLGWPMAPLAFLAIPFAIASWHDKSTRFLVAWIVPTLLVFELSATKLPHYILPIYPALAILAARMLVYEKIPTGWLAGVAKGLFLLIPLVAVIGIPVVLFVYGDSVSPFGTLLALVGLIFIVGAFFLILRSHGRASVILTVLGTLLIYTSTFGFHVPAARTIWITPQLVATLDSVQCENPQLATLGYNEPSLILMTRTDLRLLATPREASEFLVEAGCRAAFIDQPFVDEVLAEISTLSAGAAAPSVRLISRVEGLNINGGDELNMHVFAAGE